MSDTRKKNLRVGIFVMFLMTTLGGVLFLLSGSTQLLQEQYIINATWKDVGGLKKGAIVRLAGWDVGEVISIRFAPPETIVQEQQHFKKINSTTEQAPSVSTGQDEGQRLHVQLAIKTKYTHLIRQCSYQQEHPTNNRQLAKISSDARIETVGVLGDKYVSITTASAECIPLENGDFIRTHEAVDIVAYTKKITKIVNNLESIGSKLDIMLGTKSDVQLTRKSLVNSFQNLEHATQAIREGDGLVNALLYDAELKDRIKKSMGSLERGLKNLDRSSRDLSHVVGEIRTGDGVAHELIYGGGGKETVGKLKALTVAVESMLNDFKKSDSLAYRVMYDPNQAKVLEDLQVAAKKLREATEDLHAGKGTAGLFLRDPTLYEDLRALLGGAQRNKLLRSYIRRTVNAAEKENAEGWTK